MVCLCWLVVLLLGFSHVILLCHYNDTLLIKAQLGRTTLQEKHLMNERCYWILTLCMQSFIRFCLFEFLYNWLCFSPCYNCAKLIIV